MTSTKTDAEPRALSALRASPPATWIRCSRAVSRLARLRPAARRATLLRRRALAARQFKICRDVLADELGIPPMEETQALYHQIIQDADEPHSGLDGAPVPAPLPQALTTLRQAMQEFDSARSQLQRAIHLVEHLTESSPAGPKVRPR